MADSLITSVANPRIKALTALRDRRQRERQRRTVIDGRDELALAVAAGLRPEAVYHCPELARADAATWQLLDLLRDHRVRVVEVTPQVFAKVSYRQSPDGFAALAATPPDRLADLPLGRGDPGAHPGAAPALVLVCQGIEKPGNLGAMLRTADAAGLSAVVAVDCVTDWGNPNVVRASKGTVFSVPVASASEAEALSWLSSLRARLIAATPEAGLLHWDADYAPDAAPVAIAVGAEHSGLSATLLAAAQVQVRIPMAGRANSLNVATSAATVVFEALRQRRERATGRLTPS